MARGKRGPRLGKTGCLFWLLILVVIVIVILYRGKGSFRDAFRPVKKGVERTVVVEEETAEKIEVEEEAPTPVIAEEEKTAPGPEKEPVKEIATVKEPDRKKPPPAPKETIRKKSLSATLYFVKLNESDGSAKPIPVKRTVEYKDSPITRTIESLLAGSSKPENEKGIVSFIPEGTSLISAKITEEHLTLNFTGRLEENYSGREAILLEISQIILTSFSFDAVNRVSILIDGQRKSYITGEGIPLKRYYTRQDVSELLSGV